MIKLFIADDHHLFRDGIKSFFLMEQELEVVGEASDGQETLDLLKTNEVDVIIMDVSMPIMNGIETAEMVKQLYPSIKIIMLTMHDTISYIRKLLVMGVDGYLLKTTTKAELLCAIHQVMKGEKFYGSEVQHAFINSFNSDSVSTEIKLTKREKEILILICDELNTAEIAENLFISVYTVESHRKNLFAKTGAKNVVGLVKFAIENKFV